MFSLIFSLCFDIVVEHMHNQVRAMDMVQVANMHIAAALYADYIALLARQYTSPQHQFNSAQDICTGEFLCISAAKILMLHINCNSTVNLQDQQLTQVTKARYLGVIQRVNCSSR